MDLILIFFLQKYCDEDFTAIPADLLNLTKAIAEGLAYFFEENLTQGTEFAKKLRTDQTPEDANLRVMRFKQTRIKRTDDMFKSLHNCRQQSGALFESLDQHCCRQQSGEGHFPDWNYGQKKNPDANCGKQCDEKYLLSRDQLQSFEAEAVIVNYYHPGTCLGPHTDHSEPNKTAPLLSVR